MYRPFVRLCLSIFLAASVSVPSAFAGVEQEGIVDKARVAVQGFGQDHEVGPTVRKLLKSAKAVVIFPSILKGAFFVGAEGGSGVLLAKGEGDKWSYPAFYTMGSVTLGLQIGGEVSEVVLVMMSKAGRDAMLTNEFKLGGDVSVAAGPVGAGAKAQTADVLAFSRTKGGLYGGLNIEGAVVATREGWNRTYYGSDVRAIDILVSGTARNPAADALRQTVADIDTTAD
jgi:lipid-binding SYLF domain-containing protein